MANTRESIAIDLPGSKSLSNRYLVIAKLSQFPISQLRNVSISNDTRVLKAALFDSQTSNYDVEDAGTPARFLLCILATQNVKSTLLGHSQLGSRPFLPLILTLQKMGAEIVYQTENNIFPIAIDKPITEFGTVSIQAEISSQFISALMLIAPLFSGKKRIVLLNQIVSPKYLSLTQFCMRQFGVDCTISKNEITIEPGMYKVPETIVPVESDWGCATFFYSLVAVEKEASFVFTNLQQFSLQADAEVKNIYKFLGVETTFLDDHQTKIYNANRIVSLSNVEVDFSTCIDAAPAVIVCCAFLQKNVSFTGMKGLEQKESNRIVALQKNLNKFGVDLIHSNISDKYSLKYNSNNYFYDSHNIEIECFNDHRIAMAFALFQCKYRNITFDNADCVKKSFPDFWEQWNKIIFAIHGKK